MLTNPREMLGVVSPGEVPIGEEGLVGSEIGRFGHVRLRFDNEVRMAKTIGPRVLVIEQARDRWRRVIKSARDGTAMQGGNRRLVAQRWRCERFSCRREVGDWRGHHRGGMKWRRLQGRGTCVVTGNRFGDERRQERGGSIDPVTFYLLA